MKKETEEKLAASLTAETTELLPFLPYLLQDFWALGVDPEVVMELIGKRIGVSKNIRILDLACGKGAVSVRLAQKLGVKVKGIDLIPEFVEYAKQKAQEYQVTDLCEFIVGDISEAVQKESGYDCVVFGAVGDVLGDRAETLDQLKATVKPGGYLLFDNYDFTTEKEWALLFEEAGLELVETVSDDSREQIDDDSFQLVSDSKSGMEAIIKRAEELMEKHPDKRAMFKEYIKSQQSEYDYIGDQNSDNNVTWILRKKK